MEAEDEVEELELEVEDSELDGVLEGVAEGVSLDSAGGLDGPALVELGGVLLGDGLGDDLMGVVEDECEEGLGEWVGGVLVGASVGVEDTVGVVTEEGVALSWAYTGTKECDARTSKERSVKMRTADAEQ